MKYKYGNPATIVLLCVVLFCGTARSASLTTLPVDVYFSPRGGCEGAIIAEIERAQSEILVQAYTFTAAPISKALIAAHKRGVNVYVILDKSQRTERYSSATFLVNAGIPTYIDDKHGIAHNKIIILDRATVIGGSFNYSRAAEESNAENLTIIRSPELANIYVNNWLDHQQHSEPYAR